MQTALFPLQKAIFNRWSNDIALKPHINGVFDHVNKGQKFPYVTIGEPIVSPFESKTNYREEIPWTHHVWSNYKGKKECYDIMSLLLESLSKEPLQLEGGF